MGVGGRDPFLAPSFMVHGFECSQTVSISCFLSIIWMGLGSVVLSDALAPSLTRVESLGVFGAPASHWPKDSHQMPLM